MEKQYIHIGLRILPTVLHSLVVHVHRLLAVHTEFITPYAISDSVSQRNNNLFTLLPTA